MLVCASLMLAGCSAPTAPEQPPLDDALAHVQLADQLSSFARTQIGVPIAPIKLPGRTRCPYAASSGRFECEPLAVGALTYHRAYQLLGDNGAPVESWDGSVAAIRFFSEISGTLETDEGLVAVKRQDVATLGDLRELRQTLSGTATMTWSDGASIWSGQRRSDLLVMSRARMPGMFPVGTIELSADRASPQLKRSATMTFDGSPIAQMLVSFDGGASVRCRIDLQATDETSDCE